MARYVAVLVGGPCDGKGLPIMPNQNHVLIPIKESGTVDLIDYSADVPPIVDMQKMYTVAMYRYQPMWSEQETQLRFFIYDGVSLE